MSDLGWRYASSRSNIDIVLVALASEESVGVLASSNELVSRAVVQGEIPGTVPGSGTTLFRNASSARLTMRKTVRTQADMVGSVSITRKHKGEEPTHTQYNNGNNAPSWSNNSMTKHKVKYCASRIV